MATATKPKRARKRKTKAKAKASPGVEQKARILPISLPQSQILQSTEPITGYVAGRGGGKTWIGAYLIATRAKPGDPWICVSPDAGVVHDTTFPTMLEVTQRLGVYRKHLMTPYPRIWWETQYGPEYELAQMVFRSGEKPDKLRGPNKAGLWIDEASIQHEDVFLIARATLRHKGRMGPTILTMTPRGRQHWTFDVFYRPLGKAELEDELAAADAENREPNVEYIQGVPYARRPRRKLIQASTRENPFLPPEFYGELSQSYSAMLAEQELEGRFVDIAGLMFMREWFPVVDLAPVDAMRVRYWDKAYGKEPGSKHSAGVLMARDPSGIYYIEDVVDGKWSPAERNTVMRQVAVADSKRYQNQVLIYHEQEGGAGKEVGAQVTKMLAGFPVYRDIVTGAGTRTVGGVILPGGAKVTRAHNLAAQAEAGNVRMVAGGWNGDFLNQMTAFPESSLCDIVDASAGAFNRLAALAAPDQVLASKAKVAVESGRFGSTVGLDPVARRRKLFGRD